MATLADEYTLTHKRSKPKTNNPFEKKSCTNPRKAANAGSNARPGQKITHTNRSAQEINSIATTPVHPSLGRRTEGISQRVTAAEISDIEQ